MDCDRAVGRGLRRGDAVDHIARLREVRQPLRMTMRRSHDDAAVPVVHRGAHRTFRERQPAQRVG